jgi:predicted aspartyl protease
MRNPLITIAAASCMLFAATAASATAPEDCGVFVLKRDAAGVRLERVPIPAGETIVMPAGPASGIIGVVFPPGPGVSSSLEQMREGRMFVLRCAAGRLRCEVRAGGRVLSGYPERPVADLAAQEIRVSVVGGDGTRTAFLIRGNATAEPDPGPVQNLLAGTPIALGAEDYVVTTDTRAGATGARIEGEAPVELAGHAFVRVTGPDGRSGWFILDTGAAETVVAKTFLPDTVRIAEAAMVEYSSAGRRVFDYAPSGATGPVAGVLGHARLDALRAGTLRFDDVVAAVLPEFPDFFDRPVAGIIGLDLLRRAESVTLEYPPGATGAGRMQLGPAPTAAAADADVRVPFSLVSSHPVIPVRIEGMEAFMILDTGAPGAVLDSAGAAVAGMTLGDGPIMKGIDGRGITSATATIDSLQVGDRRWGGVPCRVGALPALRTLRDGPPVGLFGNALIARFERLVMDFQARSVLLAGFRQDP